MNRKDFLKASGLGATAMAISGLPVKVFANDTEQMRKIRGNTDRIFVFVVLSGGNDGLNMVIPLDKYAELNTSRANLVIPNNQVLTLTGTATTGLHPAMDKMRNMYNNGLINITQSVGYPDFNYSHFRATDIYNSSSDSAVYVDNGWVGRYLSKRFIGAPNAYPNADFLDPLAVQIGNTLSTMLTGPSGQIGFALSDLNYFYQIVNSAVDTAPPTPAGNELTFIRYVALQTQSYTQSIQNAANLGINAITYPSDNYLANQLKIVAQLISGGSKTPFYVVELGGFDTHFNQVEDVNTAIGNHAELLTKVSEAIYAFYQDLKAQSKDELVAGCTITEFGRRIKSNSSVGSDHGAASPMICFGKNVIPGINGMSPNIPMNATVSDQIPMQFDFRQVYASVLEDWFGVSKADTEEILLNKPYTKLPIFKKEPAGATSVIDYNKYELGAVSVYPNPVREHATISFESIGGATQIELYTDMGKRLKTIYESNTQKGRCSINFEREQLPAGNYFFVIMQGGAKAEGRILIV